MTVQTVWDELNHITVDAKLTYQQTRRPAMQLQTSTLPNLLQRLDCFQERLEVKAKTKKMTTLSEPP